MFRKIKNTINLISNMGWRYVCFRIKHLALGKTGILKKKFPIAPQFIHYTNLEQWKQQNSVFFFKDKESLSIPKNENEYLKKQFENIKQGKFLLFNSLSTDLGIANDWVTNPDTGYKYDVNKHWTEIADMSKEAGDIKYVWEKSRFSYIYDIIRYDYHFNTDCSKMVFDDMESWINSNPVNCGPNYRCSQEMSIRVLNWVFALHYYRNSKNLTDAFFSKVQYAIFWQMKHVYDNIDFSRIAVRNNHAITETLTLYLTGIYFPTFPNVAIWKQKGKQWFEQEVAYQVYNDGTFLQFAMNYHRVVVQLLTWAIVLSEKNGEKFADVVYDRAQKSILFLRTCMIDESGLLPNYGHNDGALFFKLNNNEYRDYRPQLDALASALNIDASLNNYEDSEWYGIKNKKSTALNINFALHQFPDGGYYIIREKDTLTFIRCGSHKDRPHQADNLHVDIWYKGENILMDAGSYKYNTDDETLRYFNGTQAHNSVMLGGNDQMLKGGRFIWYFWSQCKQAALKEYNDNFTFEGVINAFIYINKNILHKRTLVKQKNKHHWQIKDEIINMPLGSKMLQLWHTPIKLNCNLNINATDKLNTKLKPIIKDGWSSPLYGQKEITKELIFETNETEISTEIDIY